MPPGRRRFVQKFEFDLLLTLLMLSAVPFIEHFQHAKVAVGLHKQLSAAFRLRGKQEGLFRKLLAACLKQKVVSLRFKQSVHIEILALRCFPLHLS